MSEQNKQLKERFNFYKSRFNEITKKSISSTPNSVNSNNSVLKDALMVSLQKLDNLKKEKEFYSNQKFSTQERNAQDLEVQRKQLENKIKQLKQENERIKKSSTKEESSGQIDYTNEISSYKKKIFELEAKHEKNLRTLKELEQKLKKQDSFKSKKENFDVLDSAGLEKKYQKLCKLENFLKKSIKSDELKYKQRLKELETEEQKISAEKVCIQMKILKTTQQARLLELSISQNHDTSDDNYPDANFLYKPSIKALYH